MGEMCGGRSDGGRTDVIILEIWVAAMMASEMGGKATTRPEAATCLGRARARV